MTEFIRKVCKDCGVEKVRCRNFYRHPTTRDGYMHSCKDCHNAYCRENKELKRDQYSKTSRRYDARPERVAARKAYVQTQHGREVQRAAWRRYARLKRLFEARA